MSELTLDGCFRCSVSFRVRIGLDVKGAPYDQAPAHLVRNGGQPDANV